MVLSSAPSPDCQQLQYSSLVLFWQVWLISFLLVAKICSPEDLSSISCSNLIER